MSVSTFNNRENNIFLSNFEHIGSKLIGLYDNIGLYKTY